MSGTKVLNFGCRLNIAEGEAMRRAAREAGYDGLEGGAVVVNTCAVTSEAVRQARQAVRRARRENPDARIVVSGCAAQTEPDTFADMDEVDLVLGNAEKLTPHAYRGLPDFGVNAYEKVRVSDIFDLRETAAHMVDCVEGHTRAFVQVQNGCDHRCTFCVIPFGRGNARSVPAGAAVEQVRKLVANGYREVVLTGVDLTSWGSDLPGTPSLGRLVQAILAHVPDLARLRLSSIDSIEIDEALFDALASDRRLMPHFHLSLQSGDDMILKRMKRRHGRKDTLAFVERVRRVRPEAAFGADIIAGFPTETEAMFERSLAIVDEADIAFVHAFPFSPRKGTPAARMPQIHRQVVKERAARLRTKGAQALARHLEGCTGGVETVLMETGGTGRLERFTPVRVDGGERMEPGSLVQVALSGHDGERLTGTPAAGARAA